MLNLFSIVGKILYSFGGLTYSIFYTIFAVIDTIVYAINGILFNVIRGVYNTTIFDDYITPISNRVYGIMAIVMVFYVAINAIQYIVNPDLFNDSKKGFPELLKRMVVMLVLIVGVPIVFRFAMTIQDDLVQALPAIILGNDTKKVEGDEIGPNISYTILRSFISENKDNNPNGVKGKIQNYNHNSERANDPIGAIRAGEIKIDNRNDINDMWTFAGNINIGTWDMKPIYNYMIIISTACGVFVTYILISLSLELAVRVVKLSLIQMLSPIPIASYVFDKEKFNKFAKTAGQVYADLFIRMGIIYLIILGIQLFVEKGGIGFSNVTDSASIQRGIFGILAAVNGGQSGFYKVLADLIVIFGMLEFAKQAPKFITDLLGLPDISGSDLANMFRPGWQRYRDDARMLINPVRSAVNAASNSWKASEDNNKFWRRFKAVGATLRGAAQGTVDTVQGAVAGDDGEKFKQRQERRNAEAFRRAQRAKYFRMHKDDKDENGNKIHPRWESFRDNMRASWLGTVPPTADGYQKAGSEVQSTYDSVFKGRALGKVTSERDIVYRFSQNLGSGFQVTDAKGGRRQIITEFDYTDQATGIHVGNVDIQGLEAVYTKLSQGQTVTNADWKAAGLGSLDASLRNISSIQTMRKEIEKKNATEYVRIAVEAQRRLDNNEWTTEDEKKALQAAADSNIIEPYKRFLEAIETMGISDKDKADLRKRATEHFAEFITGADTTYQDFFTTAIDRRKREEATQSNGNK